MPDIPATMQELLKQRGIVAYNGVVRPSSLSPLTSSPAEQGSATSNSAPNTSGTSPTVLASTSPSTGAIDPQLASQAAQDPKVLDSVDDNTAENILQGLLAAGLLSAAAYGAYKLYRARGNPTSILNTPDVEGISNLPAARTTVDVGSEAIDGGVLTPQQDLVGAMQQRKLMGPPNSLPPPARALPDYSGPLPATRQAIGARQATQSRIQPPSSEVIHLPDTMPDVSESEYRQAITLRDQIIADRVRGRRANVRGRAGKPTADINPEGVLNEIISIMRKNRGVQGAVRRVR